MSDAELNYSRQQSYSSDSFHSDDGSVRELKARNLQKVSKIQPVSGKSHANYASITRGSSRNSTTQHGGTTASNATRRMLSAGRVKINELRNKITELTVELANAQTENKELHRQLRQRERQLNKFEQQENDAPVVVQRISEEANILREQLKRCKEKYESKGKKLQEVTDELDRVNRLLKKMRSLVGDKKLAERDDLTRKLEKAQTELEEKEQTIAALKSHIEHLNKNHKHELGIERARHRETRCKFEELQATNNRLHVQLKEKEKELEVRNIYALRQQKPPHRLDSSISSTPVPEVSSLISKPKLKGITTDRQQANESYKSANHGKSQAYDDSNYDISTRQLKKTENEGDDRSFMEANVVRQTEMNDSDVTNLRELEKVEETQLIDRKQVERRQQEEIVGHRKQRDRYEPDKKEDISISPQVLGQLNIAEEREKQKQKEMLLAKMKAIDDGKLSGLQASIGLEDHGKEARDRTNHRENKSDDVGLSFGDYKPSFLTSVSNQSKTSKSATGKKLDARSERRNDLLFSDETKDGDDKGLSYLNDNFSTDARSTSTVENNGWTNESDGYLLPRRTRQPAPLLTRNTEVTVVNDVGDDIEEVIL